MLDKYNAQLQDYVDQGVIAEIPKDKLAAWTGPVNYISHHGVIKLSSATTKLRVVSNMSLKNKGLSYNNILPKGPYLLNPLLQAITAFSSYKHVV